MIDILIRRMGIVISFSQVCSLSRWGQNECPKSISQLVRDPLFCSHSEWDWACTAHSIALCLIWMVSSNGVFIQSAICSLFKPLNFLRSLFLLVRSHNAINSPESNYPLVPCIHLFPNQSCLHHDASWLFSSWGGPLRICRAEPKYNRKKHQNQNHHPDCYYHYRHHHHRRWSEFAKFHQVVKPSSMLPLRLHIITYREEFIWHRGREIPNHHSISGDGRPQSAVKKGCWERDWRLPNGAGSLSLWIRRALQPKAAQNFNFGQPSICWWYVFTVIIYNIWK